VGIPSWYATSQLGQLTRPCIPPGSLNRVPASAGVSAGNVITAGWQVTLCDPMWHVSFRSGVATLRTAIHLLLTYLPSHWHTHTDRCRHRHPTVILKDADHHCHSSIVADPVAKGHIVAATAHSISWRCRCAVSTTAELTDTAFGVCTYLLVLLCRRTGRREP